MKSTAPTHRKRMIGMALTLLTLSLTVSFAGTLSGQQSPILSLYTGIASDLTAGDLEHQTVSSHVYLLASTPSLTPSFTFSPSRPFSRSPVVFSATASGGTEPYSFAWGFGDGSPAGSGSSTTHIYNTFGLTRTYRVTLNVTDADEDFGSTWIDIVVEATNQPPQPSFTCSSLSGRGLLCHLAELYAGDTIFIDGSQSSDPDPGGKIISYSWSLGDGTFPTGVMAVLHTYPVPDSYCITLSVIDDSGVEGEITRCVQIQPTVTLTVSSNVTQGLAPLYISFNSQVSGGRFPYTYSWDFGDGQYSNIPSPYHNYTIPGDYLVRVTVTDPLGHTASQEIAITVSNPPFEPQFFGLSMTTLQVGGALTLSGFVPLMIYAVVRRRNKGGKND